MSLPLLAALVLVALALGYRFYGGFVARQYRLDPDATTPAHRLAHGVDFVPTPPFYLLPPHFSAIAPAGAIARPPLPWPQVRWRPPPHPFAASAGGGPSPGPSPGCQRLGGLPPLLGTGGGVFSTGPVPASPPLAPPARHAARPIAEVIRLPLGARAWLAMMAFIWL